MELLQLKYFLAVAESEHMTNTAKQLHIAQPALTQSIHRLEQELGVSLFERAGRGIRLSPAGAYVRDRVKPAMETLEDVARDVQLFQQGEQGVVRVGVHAASGVAIDGIAAYSELNPHVSFDVTQDERERHRDVIVTTITPRGSSTVENAVEKTPFSERIGIVVPASSALGDTASLADFANERFIALAGSRRFREVCDTFCARRAFTPHIAFESDNPLVVKKMIGLGLGVGFWPDHSWGDLDPKSCRLVHLQEPEFTRDVIVAKTSRCTPDSEAQRFYDFLLDYVAKRWEE
ncbi:LysR family transcriptional regulator [Ellagibacter isourolithinifaciens]|uniref:LysR family transcriptional regulator n=2 Tax=Ellagibacter isourolithinifaciens TaxID=2137581 RepID=UPI0023F1BAC4|nr:LysR family transcriptional regulator [Ellagibacter isourolithinifaciens]MDD5925496.1 LysR family transcriptional regulator [Ellagibacter isourolithinifaciens]MEE0246970.1 LysR family transcriptional regulator [Ellagibacter isourolithinifaciens]